MSIEVEVLRTKWLESKLRLFELQPRKANVPWQ